MKQNPSTEPLNAFAKGMSRRRFFGLAGGLAGVGLLAATSCTKDDDPGVDLGSGDIGVLNYAYLLEQLEAAFYSHVVLHYYNNITPGEMAYLKDIRDHEIAHREFFKAALGVAAINPPLGIEFDFRDIDFTERSSVLNAAKDMEDLGVSAYNGAAKLLVDPGNLLIAGKIASVEARHAAYIHDLLQNNSFAANVVDANGLEVSRTPAEVLDIAGKYIVTAINSKNLPS